MAKILLGIFTIPASLIVIVDLLNIKELISEEWIKLLGIDKDSGHYYLFNEFINLGKFQSTFLWAVIFVCIAIIAVQIYFFWKNNRQERLLIVKHNSLNQTSFVINNEVKSEYITKPLKFNQYDTFNSSLPLEEMILRIINEVDLKANDIRKYISKDYTIGYAGIANIPATFMLGYELGDENIKKYFHKYHGKEIDSELYDDKFHLLDKKIIRSTFDKEVLQESTDPSQDGNIVILVSLTQPIKEPDYASIVGKNDFVYKYTSSDDTDYDIVDSENQIILYSNKILSDIAEIQKQKNIKEIRICVAASGAFIFGLGTKFSKTQNKRTIIYHYNRNNYPWGINVTDKVPVINRS